MFLRPSLTPKQEQTILTLDGLIRDLNATQEMIDRARELPFRSPQTDFILELDQLQVDLQRNVVMGLYTEALKPKKWYQK